MDYDVMYVDDGRNADHRTVVAGRTATPWGRPTTGNRTVVVPAGTRPTVITSRPAYGPPGYGPQGYGSPYYGQPAPFASRFGMSTGELIDTAIQILAAITPLPVAPTAVGDEATDVDNLVTYQGALATHAKRDEQLRTLGTLLVRILK
jgi:hypothetical protein